MPGEVGLLKWPYSTRHQGLHYPSLAQHGGLVTGHKGRRIGLPQGRVLPPTNVEVKTGPTLRLDR